MLLYQLTCHQVIIHHTILIFISDAIIVVKVVDNTLETQL